MPLEWMYSSTHENTECYLKVISDVGMDYGKVIGLHVLAPNAGEIIMGFAVAMKCGLTTTKLFDSVGLHPTVAEDVVNAKDPGC